MSLAVFSPYGSASNETGFLMVVARYLEKRGYGVVNIRCNGVLPQCGRDQNRAAGRTFSTCVDCMREQDQNSTWGEFPGVDLSPYFEGSDLRDHQIEYARSASLNPDKFFCEGIRVNDLLVSRRAETTLRVVTDNPEERSQPSRDETLLAARVISACSRLIADRSFDGILIPAADDLYLKSMAVVAEKRGIKLFRFRWDAQNLMMVVTGGEDSSEFRSRLYFDDISSMRSEVESWPGEIQTHLREIEAYLGITQQQLSLPIV